MLTPNRPVSPTNEAGKISVATEGSLPSLVACFVLPPQHAETLMSVLRELLRNADHLSAQAAVPTQDSVVWLTHPEAAKYLGISTTTLYRYAERERIECRKIGNRLEYRRSALEDFKQQHIRPARRHFNDGAILSAAPTSGK